MFSFLKFSFFLFISFYISKSTENKNKVIQHKTAKCKTEVVTTKTACVPAPKHAQGMNLSTVLPLPIPLNHYYGLHMITAFAH